MGDVLVWLGVWSSLSNRNATFTENLEILMSNLKEAKADLRAALTILGTLRSVMQNVDSIENLLKAVQGEMESAGPVRWVNVFEKQFGLVSIRFADNNLHESEDMAKLSRGRSNGASKNKYLGAFPVDFSSRPFPVLPSSNSGTVLADRGYQQQEAVKDAAYAFYLTLGNRNKIFTIKHIRTLLPGTRLIEAKQLVDFAIGDITRPDWFKSSPVADVQF